MTGIDPEAHLSDVEAWHSNRLKELKKPDGWLSVVGLFWLEPGENTFGSDPSNDVVFPSINGIPDRIGSFILENKQVRMEVQPGVNVTIDGESVTSEIVHGKSKRPITASLEPLHWQVIQRQDLIGVRLRNTAIPGIETFPGIKRYPVSLDWRIPAWFDRYDPQKRIEIPNILGQVSRQFSPGAVVFNVGSEEFRLDVTGNPESKSFFIVIGDATNVKDTYNRGRFIAVDAPDDSGDMHIDFNKAFNPPCAFTEHATCPVPPTQNHLSVRIEAGEKNSY
jgi:uncharacterized protein (DUF1684 family)